MKKIFSLTLLTLFLMFFSFVIFPVKIFAALISSDDWFNHISQFGFGLVKGEVLPYGSIKIVEEPGHEYEEDIIQYFSFHYEDMYYFEPGLAVLASFVDQGRVREYLVQHYEDYDGHFYWNFEEKYWQVEYYEFSELDYYKQRVDDLEDEIGLLEDEIQDLEDEIGLLEDEIQDLENEIQDLEEALDLEYDRGYNDGYDVGYSEGLLVENNNDITKWFIPLIVIIIVVGVFESINIFKKRRDE